MFRIRGLAFWGGVMILTAVVAAVFLIQPGLVTAKVVSVDESWIRPGVMVGEKDTDYYVDFFVPFLGTDSRLFFFNPQVRLDNHDGDEEHIGLGYRGLYFNSRAILGANLYYDTMKSAFGNRYNQFGIGVEALSDRFDFRANYYSPTGDNDSLVEDLDLYSFGKTSFLVNKGYEEALRGFDAEIGALIPKVSDFVETRVYVGGYVFQSDHFEDVTGFRGRLEIRPIPLLNLDIEYRDDDVRGSETFVGLYADIPFKGIKERTKFGTGARPLTDRFVEKVVRDRHIVTLVGSEENLTKVADMIYVNADNTAAGSGTYDDPYQDISMAPSSDIYKDGTWIYVFSWDDTADTYSNVALVLEPDMVLWGQGYKDPLFKLGGGPSPVFDGGVINDVITLADDNEVMGLMVQNGNYGIYGENILGTDIHDNTIVNNSSGGIVIYNDSLGADVSGKALSYTFADNQVADSGPVGISVQNLISATAIENLTITNTFSGNTLTGNTIGAEVINDITVSNVTPDGDVLAAISNVTIVNDFSGNEISAITDYGVYIDNDISAEASYSDALDGSVIARITDSSITNSFDGNLIADNDFIGVYIYENRLYAGAEFSGATLTGRVTAEVTGSEIATTFTGNNISRNYEGVDFGDNDIWADARANNGSEVTGDVAAAVSSSVITNTFIDNTINDNIDSYGVYIYDSDVSAIASLTGNLTTVNGSLTADVTGIEIANIFTGNDISRNYDGVYIEYNYLYSSIDATGGSVINADAAATTADSAITNTFTDNTINDNLGDFGGVYIYENDVEAYPYVTGVSTEVTGGLTADVTGVEIANIFTGNDISGNYDGVYIEYNYLYPDIYVFNSSIGAAAATVTDSTITNTFTDNTINNNGDYGVYMENYVYPQTTLNGATLAGGVTAEMTGAEIANTFTGNDITGNSSDGICEYNHLEPATSGSSTIADSAITDTFTDNDVSDNWNGLYLEYSTGADSDSSTVEVFMEGNRVTNNVWGIYIGYSGGGTFIGDLGGGTLGSAGGNSPYGNDTDLNNNTSVEIKAESNWWGDNDPSDQVGGDPVDYDPWLTSAP